MNLIIGIVHRPLYKINFNYTVAYNFVLLLGNDALIRMYAGGAHDNQGKGWCWLFFHIGYVIAVLIMLSYASSHLKKDPIKNDASSVVIIIAAILTAIFYNFVNSNI